MGADNVLSSEQAEQGHFLFQPSNPQTRKQDACLRIALGADDWLLPKGAGMASGVWWGGRVPQDPANCHILYIKVVSPLKVWSGTGCHFTFAALSRRAARFLLNH